MRSGLSGRNQRELHCETEPRIFPREFALWVAHASRVLVSASRRNRLFFKFLSRRQLSSPEKFAIAGRARQTRETRALPRIRRSRHDTSTSPDRVLRALA